MKRIGTLLCFFVASIIAFASSVAHNRDIVTIRYNLLNLPDTVQFRDGRQIINKYAADGKRLASTYYPPTHITVQPLSIGEVADYHSYPQYLLDRVRTWFVGNKEYGLMYPEHYDYLELKRIYIPEGYVDQYDNYHYYRRDHLGNVREVWKPSGDSTLTVQRTRYYPSGLPWEYQAGTAPACNRTSAEARNLWRRTGWTCTTARHGGTTPPSCAPPRPTRWRRSIMTPHPMRGAGTIW